MNYQNTKTRIKPEKRIFGRLFILVFSFLLSPCFFLLAPNISLASTINVPLNYTRLQSGLIGWWTMDGKDMLQNVADASGTGNNGSLINQTPTTTAQGVIGQALNFDGVDDRVNIGTPASLNNLHTMTVSAWIRPRSFSPSSVIEILTKDTGGSTGWDFTVSGLSGHRRLQFFMGFLSSGLSVASGDVVVLNQWQHVVFTWDGTVNSSGTHIYRNATETSYVPPTEGSGAQKDDSGINATIGAYSGGVNNNQFDGSIDDVRIYNRVLSTGEINQLYSMGTNKTNATPLPQGNLASNLSGWWTFDGKDVVNGASQDLSGNGNTGHLTNISTSTFYSIGKLGQGFNFDGTDDYVGVSDAASIRNIWATGGSASFWIYPHSAGEANAGFMLDKIQWTLFSYSSHSTGQTGLEFNVVWSGGTAKWRSDTTPPISFNNWHLVTLTYDGSSTSNNPILYVDGTLFSLPQIVAPSGTINSDSGSEFDIGSNLATSRASDAVMDDVRLYKHVLSPAEVAQLYAQGSSKVNAPGNNTASSLTSGLIGWWTMDGKNMISNVTDSSGNANNAFLTNQTPTTTTIGKIGQALQFDGVNDYADIANIANFDFSGTNKMTISAWVRPTGSNAGELIFSRGSVFSSADQMIYFLGVRNTDATRWQFEISDGTNVLSAELTGTVSQNQWQLVTGTWDGTNIILYKNGVQQISTNGTFTTIQNPVGTIRNTKIGTEGKQASSGFFKGYIDDLRVYNRALSATEVKQLYNMDR